MGLKEVALNRQASRNDAEPSSRSGLRAATLSTSIERWLIDNSLEDVIDNVTMYTQPAQTLSTIGQPQSSWTS